MREAIQQAPFGVFLAMVGFPLAMAAVAVYAATRARQTAAMVETAKGEPIGMATDGFRRFEGRAEAIAGQPLRAPLTGLDCVWYDARLEKWTYSAQLRESHWETVHQVESSAPLLVRDSTGACLVDMFIADVTPTDRSRWSGPDAEPVERRPPRIGPSQSFDDSLVVTGGPSSRYRYTEARIYPGDQLLVVGLFSSGRFGSAEEDEEDDDDLADDDDLVDGETGGDEDEEAAPTDPWEAYDAERATTLRQLARETTRASMSSGGRGQSLIVASATAATHVAMNEQGAQASYMVALVPLAIAAWVLLARFG